MGVFGHFNSLARLRLTVHPCKAAGSAFVSVSSESLLRKLTFRLALILLPELRSQSFSGSLLFWLSSYENAEPTWETLPPVGTALSALSCGVRDVPGVLGTGYS